MLCNCQPAWSPVAHRNTHKHVPSIYFSILYHQFLASNYTPKCIKCLSHFRIHLPPRGQNSRDLQTSWDLVCMAAVPWASPTVMSPVRIFPPDGSLSWVPVAWGPQQTPSDPATTPPAGRWEWDTPVQPPALPRPQTRGRSAPGPAQGCGGCPHWRRCRGRCGASRQSLPGLGSHSTAGWREVGESTCSERWVAPSCLTRSVRCRGDALPVSKVWGDEQGKLEQWDKLPEGPQHYLREHKLRFCLKHIGKESRSEQAW